MTESSREPSSPRTITLTTDFGHKGPYVASMKGVILTRFPEAKIIDLSHENHVHWPAEAGFWLERSHPYFPAGTVHIAVVDPGVGTGREIVCAVCSGHVFLAPDNGLLAGLVSRAEQVELFRLDLSRASEFGLGEPSATFHGRDIFAPIGADLASGTLRPQDLGPRLAVDDLVPDWVDPPQVIGGEVRGIVLTFDHFGNVITNLEASALGRFKQPVARIGGHRVPVRRTYGDVRPGEYLALINAFGALEIARAEGSARDGLGAERGAAVVLREGGEAG